MILIHHLISEMAWPLTILLAWMLGELGHQWFKLPRISVYAIVGFIMAPTQLHILPLFSTDGLLVTANIALGLILFETGYRINLSWLKSNPWIAVTSVTESLLTFIAVYFISRYFHVSVLPALLLASLSMATSPATVICVINEQQAAGQVSERTLHFSALNCVLAALFFKIIVGLTILDTSGNIWQASYSSLLIFAVSVLLGILFGYLTTAFLRIIKRTHKDSTLAFAIAVIFLVILTHALKQSPILAALSFGMVARRRRVVLSPSQQGFGTLGGLLVVILFVYIASAIEWHRALLGLGLGLAIIAVRFVSKVTGICGFAKLSGISLRKGLLVATAMMPISAFVILLLEQTRYIGVNLIDELAPLAAASLILEILGPILTQLALFAAHETSPEDRGH